MDRRTEVSSHTDPVLDASEKRLAFPEAVCRRAIPGDLARFPQAEFHGRIIYFCTDTCQSVFMSDPERFYAAHSKWRL
jgi:YHS domain-containing protein